MEYHSMMKKNEKMDGLRMSNIKWSHMISERKKAPMFSLI